MAVTKGLLSGTLLNDGQAFALPAGGVHETVHTGPTATTSYDEVWIYATNAYTADEELYLGWGGSGGNPWNQIRITIPTKAGYKLIVPGLILKGNASPLIVTGYASAANRLNLTGYVNHITA